jgi:hypothetical protein
MSTERVVLIAPVDTVLMAEPTVESRLIADAELRDVAQLLVEASTGMPGNELTLDEAEGRLEALRTGSTGEPRRDAWLGIWEGPGIPVSAILCTTWRGMPFIANVASAIAVRERGYASSLVRDAVTVFESTGATHVGISLDRESPAMHLFRELGFVEMFSTVDA